MAAVQAAAATIIPIQQRGEEAMHGLSKLAAAVVAAFAVAPVCVLAQDAAPVKIGIVTFLSGPAASPFGVPARNAAEVMTELLNAGKVPGVYATKGFGGAKVETVIIDEAGNTTTQVTEYRNLVQRHNVDVVIGYGKPCSMIHRPCLRPCADCR